MADLDLVMDWTIRKRLSINTNKTESMIFSNRQYDKEILVKFGREQIDFKSRFEFF